MDPANHKPKGRLTGRAESVANIFPTLLADLKSQDKAKRVIAAEELVVYQEHLQAPHLQRLVPEFRDLLVHNLEEEADAQLCASAASFFAPLAELETGSEDHPSDADDPLRLAGLEARPEAGWVAALLEWGAVPALVALLNWTEQDETTPWPGAYAAAGEPSCMLRRDATLPGILAAILREASASLIERLPTCVRRRAPAVRAGGAPELCGA